MVKRGLFMCLYVFNNFIQAHLRLLADKLSQKSSQGNGEHNVLQTP